MSNGFMRTTGKFVELDELASMNNGGRILFATDDFFAVAENLLRDEEPISNDRFTEYGKWMDGWETRRKRMPGHDWAIIALGKPSVIREICIDTAFFTGNFVPQFSIQAARLIKAGDGKFPMRNSTMGTAAPEEALKKMAALKTEVPGEEWAIFRLGKVGIVEAIIVDTAYNKGNFPYSAQVKGTFVPKKLPEEHQTKWVSVLPPKILSGHKEHVYTHEEIENNGPFTHVKIIIAPDGGISRFKLLGYPEEE